MSKVLPGLLYTEEDEWIKVEGGEAVIGITDHAQDSLSDIVYLELPAVGDSFSKGDTFGVIESVKAAADLYMPIDGEVITTNEALTDTPEGVNHDAFAAWMIRIKISDAGQLDSLMDADAYAAYLEARD